MAAVQEFEPLLKKMSKLFHQPKLPKQETDVNLPDIGIDAFDRSPSVAYVAPESPLSSGALRSEIARAGRLNSAAFLAWISELGLEKNRDHRKDWELAFILEVLRERDLLREGVKGLVFAVGQERIPACLAARGCSVLASDLAGEDDRNKDWQQSGQWSGTIDDLTFPDLCSPEVMRERVSFRPIDMNQIPGDLSGFDFSWSTCSFEHCGSLELGIRFLENQMECLRPGGIAVHTTEFNLSSNTDTISEGDSVIYRLRDIEEAILRLQSKGHHVEPLDVRVGNDPNDRYIDCLQGTPPQYEQKRHMRLLLGNYVSTSIRLIIRKSPAC